MPRVLIVGATGLIGREVGLALARQGYTLVALSRDPQAAMRLPFPCRVVSWPGDASGVPQAALDGVDVVLNFAGESIAAGRWTTEKKLRLRRSRLGPARALTAAISARAEKPSVYIQASAVGYYGETGESAQDETAPAGEGFLARLCTDWEAAAQPLASDQVRVVWMRFGVVLGRGGGALPDLAAVYRRGLGAVLGSGQQWLSWIHIDDLVALVLSAVEDQRLTGPVNAVAPEPCRMVDLHRQLSGRKHGPHLRVPAPLLRLGLGEAASILLTSQRAVPAKAESLNWRWPSLGPALDNLLGRAPLRGAAWYSGAVWVAAPPSEVAAFFGDERNLEMLTPPWLNFHVVGKSTPALGDGTRIRYRLGLHGLPLRWESLISRWQPPTGFVDEQVRGPYALWHHQHGFEPLAGGTLITDDVRYRVPLGRLGELFAGWLVDRDVRRIFAYRQAAIHRRFASPWTLEGDSHAQVAASAAALRRGSVHRPGPV